jgi:hypothetical protein
MVISSIPRSLRRSTISSTTREVVTTPHFGKGVVRVQKTMFGFTKTFALAGKWSKPWHKLTALRTDSPGFS